MARSNSARVSLTPAPAAIVFTTLLTLLTPFAGCAKDRPATAPPEPAAEPAPAEPAAPAAPAEPAADDTSAAVPACDELCTDIAVCWEEVNGGDYRGGGACVNRCEERGADGPRELAACIKAAENCQATLDCE